MRHTITISGFLGSGKTTLLLNMARAYCEAGMRVAILENEIGQIPVDSTYLRGQGLEVRELFGGCICCSLRTDLQEAIERIRREISPDIILVEPSGVAGPEMVFEALREIEQNDERLTTLFIVDHRRLGSAQKGSVNRLFMRLPFLEQSIRTADIVIINHPRVVDHSLLSELQEEVSARSGTNRLVVMNVTDPTEVQGLISSLSAREEGSQAGVRFRLQAHPAHGGLPHRERPAATFARKTLLELPALGVNRGLFYLSCTESLTSMLMQLGRRLNRASGHKGLGHLKVVLENGCSSLSLSLTDLASSEVVISGHLDECEPSRELSMTINAILFGIESHRLKRVAEHVFSEVLEAIEGRFYELSVRNFMDNLLDQPVSLRYEEHRSSV